MERATSELKPDTGNTILVWDLVVRCFHWSAVTLYFASYFFRRPARSAQNFRLLPNGRFTGANFVGIFRQPVCAFYQFCSRPIQISDLFEKLGSRSRIKAFGPYNPAGGAMIIALMLCLTGIGITGWMMGLDRYWGEEWVENYHSLLTDLSLAMIFLHLVGVAYSSFRHRENLVKLMVTGLKAKGAETH